MRELPSEEESREKPATSGLLGEEKFLRLSPDRRRAGDRGVGGAILTCGSAPAHEWWNGSHDCANPSVHRVYALERRVGEGVESKVACT